MAAQTVDVYIPFWYWVHIEGLVKYSVSSYQVIQSDPIILFVISYILMTLNVVYSHSKIFAESKVSTYTMII